MNYDGSLTKLADRRRFLVGRSFEHELFTEINLPSPPLESLRRPVGYGQTFQRAVVQTRSRDIREHHEKHRRVGAPIPTKVERRFQGRCLSCGEYLYTLGQQPCCTT